MGSYFGGLIGKADFTQVPSTGFATGQTVSLPSFRLLAKYAAGIVPDKIDGLAPIRLDLLASTPQDLDLSTLVDYLGAPLTVARIRFLAMKNLAETDGFNVLVGAAPSNEFTGLLTAGSKFKLFPSSPGAANDGIHLISAPGLTAMPVTSGSKILRFDPGANAISVALLIGTCSA